ncbi:MAG TPA: hypothetical protein VMF30_14710 [Pirellulales bacterium]|nr:hypothetical protein [Pirellulales bacterium]
MKTHRYLLPLAVLLMPGALLAADLSRYSREAKELAAKTRNEVEEHWVGQYRAMSPSMSESNPRETKRSRSSSRESESMSGSKRSSLSRRSPSYP